MLNGVGECENVIRDKAKPLLPVCKKQVVFVVPGGILSRFIQSKNIKSKI